MSKRKCIQQQPSSPNERVESDLEILHRSQSKRSKIQIRSKWRDGRGLLEQSSNSQEPGQDLLETSDKDQQDGLQPVPVQAAQEFKAPSALLESMRARMQGLLEEMREGRNKCLLWLRQELHSVMSESSPRGQLKETSAAAMSAGFQEQATRSAAYEFGEQASTSSRSREVEFGDPHFGDTGFEAATATASQYFGESGYEAASASHYGAQDGRSRASLYAGKAPSRAGETRLVQQAVARQQNMVGSAAERTISNSARDSASTYVGSPLEMPQSALHSGAARRSIGMQEFSSKMANPVMWNMIPHSNTTQPIPVQSFGYDSFTKPGSSTSLENQTSMVNSTHPGGNSLGMESPLGLQTPVGMQNFMNLGISGYSSAGQMFQIPYVP